MPTFHPQRVAAWVVDVSCFVALTAIGGVTLYVVGFSAGWW